MSNPTTADDPDSVIGELLSPFANVSVSSGSTLVIPLDGGSFGARMERGQIFEAPIQLCCRQGEEIVSGSGSGSRSERPQASERRDLNV